MSVRVANHLGIERVIGIDLIPETYIDLARRYGAEIAGVVERRDPPSRSSTSPADAALDEVIDAVGTEARHTDQELMQKVAGRRPVGRWTKLMERSAATYLRATQRDLDGSAPRRARSSAYGRAATPMPMMRVLRQAGPGTGWVRRTSRPGSIDPAACHGRVTARDRRLRYSFDAARGRARRVRAFPEETGCAIKIVLKA